MSKKYFISFIAVYAMCFGSEQTILDSLKTVLLRPEGLVAKCEIIQNQYEKSWADSVTVYVKDSNYLMLMTHEQKIIINDSDIFTFNYQTGQVLIDTYYPDEFTLFSLITGNFTKIQVRNIDKTQQYLDIYFVIEEMGISGNMHILENNYEPVWLEIIYSENNKAKIMFHEINELEKDFQMQADTEGWEVIDLRE